MREDGGRIADEAEEKARAKVTTKVDGVASVEAHACADADERDEHCDGCEKKMSRGK